jgi:N-acetylglucosamine kinase-like BadF-type ATPase
MYGERPGMSEPIAVGVDAGGTATVAALSRGGRYEASISTGPANPTSLGAFAAASEIALAVRQLTGGSDATALFVAAAGAGREEARDALVASLRLAFPQTPHVAVEDDTRVALRAAIPEGAGIVVIAGTGSVAYAENGTLRTRVGGAGYLLGDEGSAYAIGLAAAKLLARVYDWRARHDETTEFAAAELGAPDRDALLGAIYVTPLEVARIASLAPKILALAGAGNRASTKIVQGAAQDLGDLARAAAQQSGLQDASPSVVFAGGLLRENSLLSFLLETRITNEIPGASVVRMRDEPAQAALRFAEALI